MNRAFRLSASAALMLLSGCQQTPPTAVVASPPWQDQIIYFAMIDRFNDGDPSNNNQGAGEYDPADGRRYSGGDLRGLTQQLDYIAKLGATTVWITPPVANQWWFPQGQYGGYHGYWATNFMQVDEHYGDLSDYQALADNLHQRGMYLVQDIVANHSANLFGYQGQYDPANSASNFVSYADATPGNRRPSQAPFDQADRHNPEDVAADIYHWTPSISDYQDPHQERNYQLASLADLNTSNPQVRQALKRSYRYWIEQVGVDGFRVDTAKYVEHDFWHDFFHSDDGINAAAKAVGKADFFSFGEVFVGSEPFQDDGEQQVASYSGSPTKPELSSVIGFPLYFELDRVFAQGQPPAQLAYRLAQQMRHYANPYLVPNFVDNHDTARFLASGSRHGFKQALATIFTIPGIPVIYQGDEQGLQHSRQAMFAGGYLSQQDQFDDTSTLFRFVQQLAQLRRSDKLFSRGSLTQLYAEASGPGALAYLREYQGREVLVLMNTATSPRLLSRAELGLGRNDALRLLLDQNGAVSADLTAADLTAADSTAADSTAAEATPWGPMLPLQGSSIQVYQLLRRQGDSVAPLAIRWLDPLPQHPLTQATRLRGQLAQADVSSLQLLFDGAPATLQELAVDDDGHFELRLPVTDLGLSQHRFNLLQPGSGAVSPSVHYRTELRQPSLQVQVLDPSNDGFGLDGSYRNPTHANSGQQREILSAKAEAAGSVLRLTLTMAELSNGWQPSNGFDNLALSLFFDLSAQRGPSQVTALPQLNAQWPQGWHIGHSVYGWGSSLFRANPAQPQQRGELVSPAATINTDPAQQQITLSYDAAAFDITQWDGVAIHISSWDRSGEGELRPLAAQPGPWAFGGHGAKIMDQLLLQLPQDNQ
ncbi:alpha-amylase family glycosyl hydrolase [uncultured Ferrimonas sp.]|uniref:alpha-amylase family glycosyl hydrolase n=1 Tax=uncultured Ferrimonas sp. TaxID=432640 RepID=UPI002604B6F8|nr:alpha-amylase family glycosyl hydrolase [uncultured Ferrimonas sp.]